MKLPTIRAELCRLADLGVIKEQVFDMLIDSLVRDESAIDEVVKSLQNELTEVLR